MSDTVQGDKTSVNTVNTTEDVVQVLPTPPTACGVNITEEAAEMNRIALEGARLGVQAAVCVGHEIGIEAAKVSADKLCGSICCDKLKLDSQINALIFGDEYAINATQADSFAKSNSFYAKEFCINMTPIENQHCNRQNCYKNSEPCELGQIDIFQNGEKIGTNSVCLKLYDVDIDYDEFHFKSANGTGVCVSNFTMNGMENVQISNKLWIEGDQQKCLDSQTLEHFNILAVKNNTILDTDDFRCLDDIPAQKLICTTAPRRTRRDAFTHGRQQKLCECAKLTHQSAVSMNDRDEMIKAKADLDNFCEMDTCDNAKLNFKNIKESEFTLKIT